ncbi:MAG TPA: guanylate kinase [Syntrophomonadaceae bacterium]|nr:guanylate kinase [Syntrophomonadaceae bacterium]HPR93757.1 guanylate kinase [Syntrophomonadaceae bacterium]
MKMTRRGILFIVSGPSGVGKGTIKKAVLSLVGDLQESISATTRKPRNGEVYGREYFFLSENEFKALIEQDKFIEWANVYSNMYGTPREFVMKTMEQGKDVLLEIDIQGALQVKATMPEGVFIFIAPPSIDVLIDRLGNRDQDSPESIAARLAASEKEMSYMPEYDYVVINDKLNDAVKKTEAIIIAERCKISNMNMG